MLEKLEGYRTLIMTAVAAAVNALLYSNISPETYPEVAFWLNTVMLPAMQTWLRFKTTGPVGG